MKCEMKLWLHNAQGGRVCTFIAHLNETINTLFKCAVEREYKYS
jgi:hypothetical protein